ncbi:MAG: 50S ribosomal protein L25/general stress protein Ctc [Acidiferrobacterales bacterium]|nr:50S ribosomal protein L25/general stress protein Ctc [Acidiferrobacterales bacterium]
MSTNFTLDLTPRDEFGSSSSRRLRRAGQVPVVVYGAGKSNAHFTTDHNALIHSLDTEAFHSAIIDITESGKTQSAILREVQMHPYKTQILHIDLQRVRATEQISIRVPLHFDGDDVAPGVKTFGGIFSRLINDVEILCLPKDLPEYLAVDVSELELNQAVHISDIVLPEGVELSTAYQDSDDFAIASVTPPRVTVDDLDEDGEEEIDLEGEPTEEAEASDSTED